MVKEKVLIFDDMALVFILFIVSCFLHRWFNARKVPITVVKTHPVEDCVATGDELGKIFMWRCFFGQASDVTTVNN